MSPASSFPSKSAHPSVRREIVAILAFKLAALIALYFLFFDERPHITPGRVEQRVLEPAAAPETDHDRR